MAKAIYPIYLTRLGEVLTVVVGGGRIGERKIGALLAGGAQVRLVSPTATAQIQRWAADGTITWERRPYRPGDLDDAFLAFATTDSRAVNQQIAVEARSRQLLCNVADWADAGNFHTPAVLRLADDPADKTVADEQREMVISIGSNGRQPRRVKQLKQWLHRIWSERPRP